MGVIKVEEIVGFFIGEECVCCNCIQTPEESEMIQEKVIVQSALETEDNYYFCDRCKKRI